MRKTAEIAKEAVRTGRSIREIVLEKGLMDERQLARILSAETMTRPVWSETESGENDARIPRRWSWLRRSV